MPLAPHLRRRRHLGIEAPYLVRQLADLHHRDVSATTHSTLDWRTFWLRMAFAVSVFCLTLGLRYIALNNPTLPVEAFLPLTVFFFPFLLEDSLPIGLFETASFSWVGYMLIRDLDLPTLDFVAYVCAWIFVVSRLRLPSSVTLLTTCIVAILTGFFPFPLVIVSSEQIDAVLRARSVVWNLVTYVGLGVNLAILTRENPFCHRIRYAVLHYGVEAALRSKFARTVSSLPVLRHLAYVSYALVVKPIRLLGKAFSPKWLLAALVWWIFMSIEWNTHISPGGLAIAISLVLRFRASFVSGKSLKSHLTIIAAAGGFNSFIYLMVPRRSLPYLANAVVSAYFIIFVAFVRGPKRPGKGSPASSPTPSEERNAERRDRELAAAVYAPHSPPPLYSPHWTRLDDPSSVETVILMLAWFASLVIDFAVHSAVGWPTPSWARTVLSLNTVGYGLLMLASMFFDLVDQQLRLSAALKGTSSATTQGQGHASGAKAAERDAKLSTNGSSLLSARKPEITVDVDPEAEDSLDDDSDDDTDSQHDSIAGAPPPKMQVLPQPSASKAGKAQHEDGGEVAAPSSDSNTPPGETVPEPNVDSAGSDLGEEAPEAASFATTDHGSAVSESFSASGVSPITPPQASHHPAGKHLRRGKTDVERERKQWTEAQLQLVLEEDEEAATRLRAKKVRQEERRKQLEQQRQADAAAQLLRAQRERELKEQLEVERRERERKALEERVKRQQERDRQEAARITREEAERKQREAEARRREKEVQKQRQEARLAAERDAERKRLEAELQDREAPERRRLDAAEIQERGEIEKRCTEALESCRRQQASEKKKTPPAELESTRAKGTSHHHSAPPPDATSQHPTPKENAKPKEAKEKAAKKTSGEPAAAPALAAAAAVVAGGLARKDIPVPRSKSAAEFPVDKSSPVPEKGSDPFGRSPVAPLAICSGDDGPTVDTVRMSPSPQAAPKEEISQPSAQVPATSGATVPLPRSRQAAAAAARKPQPPATTDSHAETRLPEAPRDEPPPPPRRTLSASALRSVDDGIRPVERLQSEPTAVGATPSPASQGEEPRPAAPLPQVSTTPPVSPPSQVGSIQDRISNFMAALTGPLVSPPTVTPSAAALTLQSDLSGGGSGTFSPAKAEAEEGKGVLLNLSSSAHVTKEATLSSTPRFALEQDAEFETMWADVKSLLRDEERQSEASTSGTTVASLNLHANAALSGMTAAAPLAFPASPSFNLGNAASRSPKQRAADETSERRSSTPHAPSLAVLQGQAGSHVGGLPQLLPVSPGVSVPANSPSRLQAATTLPAAMPFHPGLSSVLPQFQLVQIAGPNGVPQYAYLPVQYIQPAAFPAGAAGGSGAHASFVPSPVGAPSTGQYIMMMPTAYYQPPSPNSQ